MMAGSSSRNGGDKQTEVRRTEVGSDEKGKKNVDKAEVTKKLILPDFDMDPLWIMESDGLINIDPYDYLTADVVLIESLLAWSNLDKSNFLPHNPGAMRLPPLCEMVSFELDRLALAKKVQEDLNLDTSTISIVYFNNTVYQCAATMSEVFTPLVVYCGSKAHPGWIPTHHKVQRCIF